MKNPLYDQILTEFFTGSPTKGQLTKLRILEAAIQCYATHGVDHSTYEAIADAASTSKQLVKKHFPDKEELFVFSVKFIRAQFQNLVLAEMAGIQDPVALITAYIRVCFLWVKKHERHALVWGLFLYYCGFNDKLRKLHTQMVKIGHSRIMEIIRIGNESKDFHVKDVEIAAKLIQTLITGSMFVVKSENLEMKISKLEQSVYIQCLSILGHRPNKN